MKKRFLSLMIALAMMVGVFTPLLSSAAEPELEQTTKKVTVHKLIPVDKKTTAEDIKKQIEALTGEKKYVGQQLDLATDVNKAKEIDGVYFVWTNAQDQVIDESGNTIKKDGKEITITNNKLPEGIEETDLKGALAGLTGYHYDETQKKDIKNETEKGHVFNTSKLPAASYKIYEIHSLSKYVGKDGETLTKMLAVPVVITLPLNDVKEAHVYPKNVEDKPQIDKNFASNNGLGTVEDKNTNINSGANYNNYGKDKATAKVELGKKVPYEVKTQIPAEAKYKKLVWTDQMTEGLTYNKDLKVMLGTTQLTEYKSEKEPGDYKVISTDRGFTLKFTDGGLTKVEEEAKTVATEITLTYSATVNANAIPGKADANDVAFDYSNKPGKDSEPKEGKPNNGEIKVEKSWAVDGNAVTEADKNVKALFTLQVKDGKNWKDVESYEATAAENFKHTFTGLDNNKTYRVVEQVSGYEAEYVSFENGVAVIKNNKDTTNPKPLNPTEPKVVTGGKKFVKADQTTGERLEGAEFKVKKTVGQEVKFLKEKDKKDIQKAIEEYKAADKAYKDAVAKLTQKDGVITYPEGVTAETIKTLKETRDQKFEASKITYEWGTEIEASVFKSNSKGQVEVIGLEYEKNYTLVETKAPEGYGTPTNNETSFTVDATSYTTTANGVKYAPKDGEADNTTVNDTTGEAIRINNKKVTIPQTGGIGTIIFTAIGLAIMASAIIAIKKRQATEAR